MSEDQDYQDALARIEREVEEGRSDLGALGFWRLVRQIKQDPALSHHWAEEVGRVDRAAFERRVRPPPPGGFGERVLLVGAAALVGPLPVADGPFRIQPGIKVDYASYLRASPGARAWMHAAGAVASKIAPFAVFAAVDLPHRAANYDLFPPWAMWGVLGFGVLQIVTDVWWSTRKSDWKKVRRELRLARAQRV